MSLLFRNPYIYFALILSTIGVIELTSINPQIAEKQVAFIILALLLYTLFSLVPLKFLRISAYLVFGLSLILLILVLLTPQSGPKRWINIGLLTFQPSEFAKISLSLLLAKIYSETRRKGNGVVLKALLLSLLPLSLVLIEPDLGTSVIFYFIFLIVTYTSGVRLELFYFALLFPLSIITSFSPLLFLILFVLTAFGLYSIGHKWNFIVPLLLYVLFLGFFTPLLWKRGLKDYQRERIVAFLSPEKYSESAGWQTLQARIALGSGGIIGKGFKRGTQKGLEFLPAAHTDFIFSSFGEEFGFIGTLLVLLIFALFTGSIFKLVWVRDEFSKLFAVGIGSVFLYHIVVNIGGNLGILPITGIPLPFISYGGSHLISEYISIGILTRIRYEGILARGGDLLRSGF
jgi:rod shape determining protein RodA